MTFTTHLAAANNHDKFAVSFLKNATVGHVPREFLRVFWHFLRHGSYQSKKGGKGLEIPILEIVLCTTSHVLLESSFVKHMCLTCDGNKSCA